MYTVILYYIKLCIIWAAIKYVSDKVPNPFDKIWSCSMHTTSHQRWRLFVVSTVLFLLDSYTIYILIYESQKLELPRIKYRNLYENNYDTRHGGVVKRIQPDDIFIHLNMRSRFSQAHQDILLHLTKNLSYI